MDFFLFRVIHFKKNYNVPILLQCCGCCAGGCCTGHTDVLYDYCSHELTPCESQRYVKVEHIKSCFVSNNKTKSYKFLTNLKKEEVLN